MRVGDAVDAYIPCTRGMRRLGRGRIERIERTEARPYYVRLDCGVTVVLTYTELSRASYQRVDAGPRTL